MLVARPDLVSNELRSLPDVTVHNWDELYAAGRRAEWRGYWSAPALADANVGRRTLDAWASRWARLALRAVNGEDISKLPRFPDGSADDPAMRMSVRTVNRQHELDGQFVSWLAQHRSIVDR